MYRSLPLLERQQTLYLLETASGRIILCTDNELVGEATAICLGELETCEVNRQTGLPRHEMHPLSVPLLSGGSLVQTCRRRSVAQRPSWAWCSLRTCRASLIFACSASGDSRRWRSSPLSISRSIPEAVTNKGGNFHLYLWAMPRDRKKHVAYNRAKTSPDSSDAVAHAAHEIKYP